MRHFKNFFSVFRNQRLAYFIFVGVLFLPSFLLLFTQENSFWRILISISLPLGAYLILMALARKPGKMLWLLFPLVFLGAFQIVLLYLFGGSVIGVDMFLNVATTSPGEAFELLDKLLPAIATIVGVYIPALILGAVSMKNETVVSKFFRRFFIKSGTMILILGFFSTLVVYGREENFAVKSDVFPVNVIYNLKLAFQKWYKIKHYPEISSKFKYNAFSTRVPELKEIYVMVIGETSRAYNWEIYGYPKNTNPYLASDTSWIVYRDVLTQSNTTHKVVPIFLSPASAENYGIVYECKSIITAFKEAGFKTAFFSNQSRNRSFTDFFGEEADVYVNLNDSLKTGMRRFYDRELLKYFEEFISSAGNKCFVVLHTYGSHFNYNERYPEDKAYFRPDRIGKISLEYRESLTNAFDNTIRGVDEFLYEVKERLKRTGAVSACVYASDHGEDIIDDERNLFLHASPVPSFYQLHIPLLFWMSDAYVEQCFSEYRETKKHRNTPVTTNVIFHSFLEIGGISTPYLDNSRSVAGTAFREAPRFYLDDHDKARPYNDLGMKEEDVEMFRRFGLKYP